MDFLLAEKDANPTTQVAMRGGLALARHRMRRSDSQKTFVDATDAQRRQILDDIAYPAEGAKPGMRYGVTFFNRLPRHDGVRLLLERDGWKDLQYIGNVFNPATTAVRQPRSRSSA